MINTFDPDALIVGGGVLETSPEFQQWFLAEIRAGMPNQREEQANIPIHLMPKWPYGRGAGRSPGSSQTCQTKRPRVASGPRSFGEICRRVSARTRRFRSP
jgi:hypothetical protein